MDRVRQGLAALRAQFEGMGEKQRRLALGFVSAMAVLAVLALTLAMRSVVADHASRVGVARDGLVQVEEMVTELAALKAKIGESERRMGQFHANQMNTYLEGWAKKAGVSDSLSVRPGQVSTVGAYQAVPYNVQISKVDLGSLLTFLYAMETSPYPIKVRTARVRAEGRQDDRKLRVDLEVVAYSKEQG